MRSVFDAFSWFLKVLAIFQIFGAGLAAGADSNLGPSKMAPGLVEDVFKPFFEDEAFPLKTLIALYPDNVLKTSMGRCVSLVIFGQNQTERCERRMGLTYTGDLSTVRWFTMGTEAIGLASVPPLDPPEHGVLRYMINTVYRLQAGQVISEPATGTCRVDAFFVGCHTIGKSGHVDVDFATLGGPATQQHPVEDAIFQIPKAEVFTARGQCVSLKLGGSRRTPYCASFVGQAILDKRAITTFFTGDGNLVFGFYGLVKDVISGPAGAFTIPITSMLRIEREKAGTAPVEGFCRESPDAKGNLSVDCKVKTRREGFEIDASFETVEPWQKATPPKRD